MCTNCPCLSVYFMNLKALCHWICLALFAFNVLTISGDTTQEKVPCLKLAWNSFLLIGYESFILELFSVCCSYIFVQNMSDWPENNVIFFIYWKNIFFCVIMVWITELSEPLSKIQHIREIVTLTHCCGSKFISFGSVRNFLRTIESGTRYFLN